MIRLSPSDKQHPLWRRLLEHFELQLSGLRAKNDSDLDPTKTAGLRGQIAVYRALVALDRDPPEIS